MGIIKATIGAIGGNLADQWLETIEADDMSDTTVFTKGVSVRRGEKRFSNKKGSENVISNGSVIHVYPNQFMMLVDGGKIVDFAHVPEKYEFEPMFVMGRAALNFIDLCGVHRAFFDAEYDNETLILAIGFTKNASDRYEMDLTDFFKEPCQHGKK